MKFTVLSIILLIAFCSIHVIEAGFRGGGSRGGSRGGGSRGGSYGGGWGGGGHVSRPSKPIYQPPVHIPSQPVYKPPIHSSPPAHKPSPPISPPIHYPPVNVPPSHGGISKPSAPHPGTTNVKDSSSIFINNEGGGRPRPGNSYPDWANPGAKPPPPIGSPIGSGHPPFPNTNHNPPSPPNTKPYPDWANPGTKPGSPPYPGANPPPSNPNSHYRPYPPVTTSGQNTHARNSSFPSLSAPYPAPKPNLPYPSSHPNNMPQPNAPHIGFQPGVTSGVGGHYPNSPPLGSPHITPSHHTPTLGAPPHLQSHPAPYPVQPGYPGGYSGGYHPMGQPGMVHNPYPMQSQPGMPNYGHQPMYGGPSMSQPYVPGQTIILPSQSSSGPGIGQLVKEALVFSAVNAGVNRLINGAPHQHHYVSPSSQVQPAGGGATVTNNTTIIYNNYGPGDQGQGTPGAPPSVPGAYVPSNPESYTPGNPGSGYVPNNPGSYPSGASGAVPFVPNPNPGSVPPLSPPASGSNPPVVSGGSPNPAGIGIGSSTGPASPGSTNVTASSAVANGTNQNVAEAPPAPQYYIADDVLMKLTETLFSKEEMNLKKYVTLYVQNKAKAGNVTDEAPGPLMYTSPELDDMPTVRMMKNMFDNYQLNSTVKENSTSEIMREESLLLDTFLNTDIMSTAMNWLASKYYIEPDDFEMKDTLRHIWFNKIDGATSGFERIFLAEIYPGPSLIGAQNWIYFAAKEASKDIDYMGYIEERAVADKASLLKLNLKMGDAVKQNATMLVGTSPELEMALYTVCFYARPNDICPVSLGGTQFYLYTHSFRYFGKDLIDVGIIAF